MCFQLLITGKPLIRVLLNLDTNVTVQIIRRTKNNTKYKDISPSRDKIE
jgi:hypothetical protein